MNLGLTVVTHTVPTINRDISRSLESISMALPDNSRHIIIEHDGCFDTFLIARYDALKLDDIVIFVDDDDYISPESLRLCKDALSNNDVGIAFTNEIKVMENGIHRRSVCPIMHSDICNHPETIHHMVAYRTKYINKRSLELALKYECGIEWTTKVDAALTAGAIFIPHDGYYWIQHTLQTHRTPEIQKKFKKNLSLMSDEMKGWVKQDSEILTWCGLNK